MATPQVARSNEVAQRNKSLRRTREPDGGERAIARSGQHQRPLVLQMQPFRSDNSEEEGWYRSKPANNVGKKCAFRIIHLVFLGVSIASKL